MRKLPWVRPTLKKLFIVDEFLANNSNKSDKAFAGVGLLFCLL